MDDTLSILKQAKVIAVVGLSDNPERPSYDVASYLLEHGYTTVPVNPNIREWKGIKAYPSLSDVKVKIDVVDIFRRSEEVGAVVDEAIKVKAKAVWMQLGIVDKEAAARARAAGLKVVMDRCMKIEHMRLVARIPELPGCSLQIEDGKNPINEVRRAISAYLATLSEIKPPKRKESAGPSTRGPQKTKR